MRRETTVTDKQEDGQELWGDRMEKKGSLKQRLQQEDENSKLLLAQEGPRQPLPAELLTCGTPKIIWKWKVWLPKLGHRNKICVASFLSHAVFFFSCM